MIAQIEVKKTEDGVLLARRKDGRPLTVADREEAKRLAGAATETPTVDRIVDERVVAVLIDSEILGAPIWFALRDGWQPDDGDNIPIFYVSELPALRSKTAEQLRSIFNIKCTFGGGMVRQ